MNDATLRVALTFDAEHPDRSWCPPGNVERIIDTLGEEAVRATFFVQGRWASSQPSTAQRIADDGHLIGHHSQFHARMSQLSAAGLRADMLEGQRAIVDTTGNDPRPWFRCPFGAGRDDPTVVKRLERLGYRNVHWDVELLDWEPSRTGPMIAADAVAGVRSRGDGVVVLLHTWPGGTGEAVPSMIRAMKDLGASFVTVADLDEVPS